MNTFNVGDCVTVKYGRPVWVRKTAIRVIGQRPHNLISGDRGEYLKDDYFYIDLDRSLIYKTHFVRAVLCEGRVLELESLDGKFFRAHHSIVNHCKSATI